MKTKFATMIGTAALGLSLAATAAAQQVSRQTIDVPDEVIIYGEPLPPVVKATAIVNGEIITQTDINQRLALVLYANDAEIPLEQRQELARQVLRNLIDETLQIQAAEALEIDIAEADVTRAFNELSRNFKQSPQELANTLQEVGASVRTYRQQIKGELAWRRLQSAKIVDTVSVGDDEVNAVIEKIEGSKGQTQYRVGEIFLASTPATDQQVQGQLQQITEALSQGASFVAVARQYSQASTAAVGGDLGWVRPEQLPEELAAAVAQMAPGSISRPIPLAGGYSIVAVQDVQQILTADPRNAVLSLKQITIPVPAGTSEQDALPMVDRLAADARALQGCGGAATLANSYNGTIVDRDGIAIKDLPPFLQQMMLPMQVGQATQPFGNIEDGVRVLVICGRDEENPALPSFDEVYSQLNDERVNMRARRYLRDLRRDAIIEFR